MKTKKTGKKYKTSLLVWNRDKVTLQFHNIVESIRDDQNITQDQFEVIEYQIYYRDFDSESEINTYARDLYGIFDILGYGCDYQLFVDDELEMRVIK